MGEKQMRLEGRFSKISPAKLILAGVMLWVGFVTVLHMGLNVDWSSQAKNKLNVAYIPVT